MNELPSSEFRKVYGKLREPTVVTVNGHPIGQWTPMQPMEQMAHVMGKVGRSAKGIDTQALRDDLLRKINRGK